MKRFCLLYAPLWAALMLSACGGGSSGSSPAPVNQTPAQKIAALENSGQIPRLDRADSVGGTDANINGVRDDVEAFIAANYSETGQRAAATQFASVMQAAMTVNTSNAAAVKEISIRSARAINCLYRRFDGNNGSMQPAAVAEQIKSVSTNTKARLLAYLAYAKALDGTAGSLPEGDTCE